MKYTSHVASLLAFAITLLAPSFTRADDLADIKARIWQRHDNAVKRLHDWIAQVSIAAR